ncbi:outer membrane beta-barrel family protein [Pedobacter psychroterrae]|uniref:TonB-dependent receptor n=1 Tax=Pedobacter psychroterrae TaxID=2530453 RepID=A0A4R0NQP5_9SPHI|nr:outer membrane beta-barrel family protein [Pedobacter psychroterrae]TCD03410.1 TonB-dependent receptor [Pedobacter psychroterrae]
MKVFALLNFLLLICVGSLFAQKQYLIKGTVTDSMATYKMVKTSISVLNEKDSILLKYTRADAEGNFILNSPKSGKFILLVTYPGYADYVENFILDSVNTTKDFGSINLILKATLLQDVIIQGKVASIKIKGDTTEYNAGSYSIAPNSKVEDLLKQLPGIQVDKDGKITAQGETVNKVLVDGEEFFGDDPTLVTKNIRGDMVDKVQLYDKKSDQATFTGIDDGEKSKTINIKLKEDKKNGYFGKLEGGVGTDKFYNNQAMFNAFKGKQKFSAFGIFGNTGQTGLGWQDRDKYGGSGNSMEFSDDGGIMFFSGGGDDFDSFDGQYNGEGIPSANSGGLHYENKWDSDKHGINSNYKAGSISIEAARDNLTQNNLPGGLINSSSNQKFDNMMFRQKGDVTYTIKLDTTSTLKVSIDGTIKNSKTSDDFISASLRGDNSFLNSGIRTLTNDADQQLFNANALWTKKLKKKGRTLSVNVKQAINDNDTKGFLNSTNKFFNEQNNLDSTQVINQYKTNYTSSAVFNTNMTYTEPLSKMMSLILNYGLGVNNSSSDRKSFNQSVSGEYDILDKEFSNDFELDQLSNQGGATFNLKMSKSTINFGTKISGVRFQQFDAYTDKTFKRNFINWNPQASFQYRFSQQKSMRFSYYGNTTQPGIDQIQPVRVNTDPLNITLGNPDLRPSFRSNLSVGYNSYKILSDQYIYMNGGYSFTTNPIINLTTTDQAGKNTYESINLGSKNPYNFYFSSAFSRKIKGPDISVGIDLDANGNVNYTMVSNKIKTELNTTKSSNYSGGLNFSKYKDKKYSFRVSGGPSYNIISSSLQTRVDNKGWGIQGNGSFNVYLPGKIELSTDGYYQYTGKTQTFDQDLERFIWNASISKKFFKQENLMLSLSGRDLLNQNVGFSRYASGNMVTQNSYTTIQRYFMCTLSWDFSKMGGSVAKK